MKRGFKVMVPFNPRYTIDHLVDHDKRLRRERDELCPHNRWFEGGRRSIFQIIDITIHAAVDLLTEQIRKVLSLYQ